MASPEAVKALQLVKQQIRAGRARIERRVDFDLEREKLDPLDVWECLCAAGPEHIDDYSPDRGRPERTVLELKVQVDKREFYCKVSVNVDVNHDPMVLSFKPWHL